MTHETTLAEIRVNRPCQPGWKKLLKNLAQRTGKYPTDKAISLETILSSNGPIDALWTLDIATPWTPEYRRAKTLLAAWMVERIMPGQYSPALRRGQYARLRKRLDAAIAFGEGRLSRRSLAAVARQAKVEFAGAYAGTYERNLLGAVYGACDIQRYTFGALGYAIREITLSWKPVVSALRIALRNAEE
jgi:hypothetical protein